MSHTPGPWIAVPNPADEAGYDTPWTIESASEWWFVANIVGGLPEEQADANAALIAAAPDLLETARKTREALVAYFDGLGDCEPWIGRDVLSALETVIAKASGEAA